jgi:hypothetical protein
MSGMDLFMLDDKKGEMLFYLRLRNIIMFCDIARAVFYGAVSTHKAAGLSSVVSAVSNFIWYA